MDCFSAHSAFWPEVHSGKLPAHCMPASSLTPLLAGMRAARHVLDMKLSYKLHCMLQELITPWKHWGDCQA